MEEHIKHPIYILPDKENSTNATIIREKKNLFLANKIATLETTADLRFMIRSHGDLESPRLVRLLLMDKIFSSVNL